MGIFDDIAGKVQGLAGGGDSGIVKAIMEMLSSREGGGLNGIIQSFQQRGMGDIVTSWIGKGPNKPISPVQIREGLGSERVQQVATKAGISTDEAATKLSRHLPDIVDKVTPDGVVPEGGMLDKGLDLLKSKFG